MLKIARLKPSNVNWLLGSAESIPARDGFFDGGIATLTVHHWEDLGQALAEIARVLNANAKMVIFTADPQQMKRHWLNRYFPDMMERAIAQMPDLASIEAAGIAAGFKITGTEKYFIHDQLRDLFLYSGKNNPALYLQDEIRKGISSFAVLADREELEQGLLMLKADMASGKFDAVKVAYDDEAGDYLFITMEKC